MHQGNKFAYVKLKIIQYDLKIYISLIHMADTSVWTKKYRPKTISQLVTNTKGVKAICDWLNTFDKIKKEKKKASSETIKKGKKSEFKSCLLVTGNHGVGKTVSVDIILNNLNYDIQKLDITSMKSIKNAKEFINKIMVSSNILNMISGDVKKLAIVIDEIESVTSSAEKSCLMGLQKLNELHWYCPIIFISNNKHNKFLSEIKKIAIEVRFWPPYPIEMKKILIKIATNEKIKFHGAELLMDNILQHSQNDIRRLIFTLQDLRYTYGDAPISLEMLNNYCEMAKLKDVDIDLYKATEILLYNYTSMNDCLKVFETEKVIIPLMVHQYYIKNIIANHHGVDTYKTVKKIAESLSAGDVIENYIYGDQNWDMQEIHGFYTTVIPSFYMHKPQGAPIKKVELGFATDLNKTSIKKINKKTILNLNRYFSDMNIIDYIYINKLMRELLNNKDMNTCVDLITGYGIGLDNIESLFKSLLKIDKIEETAINFTARQKNELLELFSKKISSI